MQRKLASLQTVESVEPIVGSDNIEKIRVLGWTLVAKRGEFRPGESCIYFEVDSILPEFEVFEFMRAKKFRVKAIKIRGVVSMGLAIPIDEIRKYVDNPPIAMFAPGADWTEILNVKKWESEENGVRNAKGPRPFCVPKTDEIRLQSVPGILPEMAQASHPFYITEKLDGTSCSMYIFQNPDPDVEEIQFGVTSRNMELKAPVEGQTPDLYWRMAIKYNVEEKLRRYFPKIGEVAIQGEICGPGVQKNRLQLKETDFFVFSVYDIEKQQYFNLQKLLTFCGSLDLRMVPILNYSYVLNNEDWLDVDSWVKSAEGASSLNTKVKREGIVVKSKECEASFTLNCEPFSFKVINPEYLLKHGE